MVKLHHSFLFAALGIASAASAAAIVNGGEQAAYLARRFIDNHPQALISRDEGNGQGGQGNFIPDLPSPGPGPGNGGGGDHPKHRRSLYPDDDEGAPSEYKKRYESVICDLLDKQLAQQFATTGHCPGPESPSCHHYSCSLDAAGCTEYTDEEKRQLSALTKQLVLKVSTLGKCKPSPLNASCSDNGYCDYWQCYGNVDQAVGCEQLDKQEAMELFSKLRPQPDGSYDFVDNVKGKDADDLKPAASSPDTQAKKVPRTFGKRSVPSGDAATWPQDASKPVKSGSAPVNAGVQPVGGAGVSNVEPSHGDWQVKLEAIKRQLDQAAAQQIDGVGQCDDDGPFCQNGECMFGLTPKHKCNPLTSKQKQAKIDRIKKAFWWYMVPGKCDPCIEGKSPLCRNDGLCQRIDEEGVFQNECLVRSPEERMDDHIQYVFQPDRFVELLADQPSKSCSKDEHRSVSKVYGEGITQQQFNATIKRIATVAAEMDVLNYGVCAKGSSVCTKLLCRLKTPDCKTFTEKDKEEYQAYLFLFLYTVASGGPCEQGSSICPEHNYCHVFLDNGDRSKVCHPFPPESLQSVLRGGIQTLFDLGEEASSDNYPSNGAYILLSMYPPFEADTYLASSSVVSNTDMPKYVPSPGDIVSGTVEFLGERKTAQQLAQKAVVDAKSYIKFFRLGGNCADDAPNCQEPCEEHTPGCTILTQKDLDRLLERITSAFTNAYLRGTCDPFAKDSVTCNAQGLCKLWTIDGQLDQGCTAFADNTTAFAVFRSEGAKIDRQNDDDWKTAGEGEGEGKAGTEPVQDVNDKVDSGLIERALSSARFASGSHVAGVKVKRDGSTSSSDNTVKSTLPAHRNSDTETKRDVPSYSSSLDSETVEIAGVKMTQEQLSDHVLKAAAHATDLAVRIAGHCGEESETCRNHECFLGVPGCRPFTEVEAAAIEDKYVMAYSEAFFTGACPPASGKESGNCDASGRCMLWIGDGTRDTACAQLTKRQFHHRLLVTLEELGVSATPWAVGSNKHKIKHDVSSSSEHEHPETSEFHGVKVTEEQVNKLADSAASQAVALAFYKLGYCDENSSTCYGESCKLGTPGCIAYPEEVIDEYEHKFAAVYRRVFKSGTCNARAAAAAAAANDGESVNCDKFGQCQLWVNGERDHHCKQLDSEEVQSRLEAEMDDKFATNTPGADAGADAEAGAGAGAERRPRQKRNLDHHLFKRATSSDEDDNTATIHGVKLTLKHVYVLADKAAKYANTYEFDGVGYCDPKSSTCRTEFCDLGKPGCIAYSDKVKHDAYLKFLSIYRSVMTSGTCNPSHGHSGCLPTGRCKLWSSDGTRDHACAEPTSKQFQRWLEAAYDTMFVVNQLEADAEKGWLRKRSMAPSDEQSETALFNGVRMTEDQVIILADKTAKQLNTEIFEKGYCKHGSSKCREEDCDIGTPDCIPWSAKFQAEYFYELSRLFRRVFKSGVCHPSRHTDSRNCSKSGRCKLWPQPGKRDHKCHTMTSEQANARLEADYNKLRDELYARAPEKAGARSSAKHRNKDDGAAKRPLQKRSFDYDLFKRALSDLDHNVKSKPYAAISHEHRSNTALVDDVEMTQPQVAQQADLIAQQVAAYSTEDSGICAEGSSTCRDEYCSLSTPGCIAYSDDQKLQLQNALSIMLNVVLSSGSCDAASAADNDESQCNESGVCSLWLDDGSSNRNCKPLKGKQLRDRLKGALQDMYAPGAADVNVDDAAARDGDGKGSISNKEKRDVRQALVKRALEFGSIEDLSKRDVSGSDGKAKPETALINGVPMTHEQVHKEAARIASKFTDFGPDPRVTCREDGATCSHGHCYMGPERCQDAKASHLKTMQAWYAAELEAVFRSGTCNINTDTDGLFCVPALEGGMACHLWSDDLTRAHDCKELTKEQLKTRLEASLDRFLERLAPVDQKNDGAEKPAVQKRDLGHGWIKRELIEGPVRQHLFERIFSGDENDVHRNDPSIGGTRPGFITVDKSSLLSSSKLYQPTDDELADFMAVCDQLSHDPDALEQVAEASGVYDEQDVEVLREHFAKLAHDKEEATEVMQHAKMQQMVRESKNSVGATTAETNGGAAAGVDKLRKADAGAGGAGGQVDPELDLHVDNGGDGGDGGSAQ